MGTRNYELCKWLYLRSLFFSPPKRAYCTPTHKLSFKARTITPTTKSRKIKKVCTHSMEKISGHSSHFNSSTPPSFLFGFFDFFLFMLSLSRPSLSASTVPNQPKKRKSRIYYSKKKDKARIRGKTAAMDTGQTENHFNYTTDWPTFTSFLFISLFLVATCVSSLSLSLSLSLCDNREKTETKEVKKAKRK